VAIAVRTTVHAMTHPDAQQRADLFHQLHHGREPLVLVNAWDAASARVIERAGAAAIATSSAAMAWSLGYPDGEQLPVSEFLVACARIARVCSLPLSVDVERGFGRSTDEVCGVVRALIELGVVGINIEDGVSPETHLLAAPDAWCERIAAMRALATEMDVRLFINARTDTYFTPYDDPAARYRDTVQRAQLAAEAGADGVFVPGMDRIDDIARFTRDVALPVNVYAGYAGVPAVPELTQAGVRRVSLGCGPLQSALGLLQRLTTETLQQGSYELQCNGMLAGREVNGLFPLNPRHGL
jgi:2-methylisocitrate lyase-like PEP mutase family enzyme